MRLLLCHTLLMYSNDRPFSFASSSIKHSSSAKLKLFMYWSRSGLSRRAPRKSHKSVSSSK